MQRYRILASSMFLILVGFSTGHSAEPVKGTGDWTLYYIAEASSDVVKSGGNVAVITRDGEKLRYQVAPAELRKATVEGTAAGKRERGSSLTLSPRAYGRTCRKGGKEKEIGPIR